MMDLSSIQVVFQDIDGCLNPFDSKLPDGPGRTASHKQARMLRQIGTAIDASNVTDVVLNTGRAPNCIDFVLAELASEKIRFILAEHGAVAFDVLSGTHINLAALAAGSAPSDCATRYAALGSIRDAIIWYRDTGESELSSLFGCPLPALPKDWNLTLRIPSDQRPVDVASELEQSITRNPAIDSTGFAYHFSEEYVDVVSRVTKADGALMLLDELNLDLSSALAMGDGENDIPLFEVLNRGFCPENSSSKLKLVCKQKGGVVSSLRCGEAAMELYGTLLST